MPADAAWAYRGGIAVGSLTALALVLACAHERPPRLLRALELRPVEWVGERSYGLYLWHWPVILVVREAFGDAPGTALWWRVPLVALVVTFVLAAVRGPRPLARTAAVAVATLVLGAAVSVATAPRVSSTQAAIEAALQEIADHEAAPADDPTDAPSAGPTQGPSADPSHEPTQAPGSAPTKKPGTKIDGADVIAFGDSVLSAAAPTLYDAFPLISIDAKPIRQWADAPARVRTAKKKGRLRPVVLLNFGTNGGLKDDAALAALDETLDIIGPDRQVIVYTIVGVSYWVDDANATLIARVAGRPNVHVID